MKLKSEVRERAESVLQQAPILKRDVIRIDFFCGYGFDPFCIGSAKLMQGALIGLPVNFAYTSTADVDTFNIKVTNDLFEREERIMIWNCVNTDQM